MPCVHLNTCEIAMTRRGVIPNHSKLRNEPSQRATGAITSAVRSGGEMPSYHEMLHHSRRRFLNVTLRNNARRRDVSRVKIFFLMRVVQC